jgi:hypothetical protein
MKVDPNLPNHPKYIRLRGVVGEYAMEALIRLWAHCAANKRGEFWPLADENYVETVCAWRRKPGMLYKALVAQRMIHEEAGGIRVHDWNKENSRAISNWHTGSLPKTKRHSSRQANEEPMLEDGGSRLTDSIVMTEGREGNALSPLCPEVAVPGKEEVLRWAEINGVDKDWAEDKLVRTTGNHGWEKNGRLIEWKEVWLSYWRQDVREGKVVVPKKTPPASGAVVVSLQAMRAMVEQPEGQP